MVGQVEVVYVCRGLTRSGYAHGGLHGTGAAWFENLGKRVVKSPKVDLRDSDVLHPLLEMEENTEFRLEITESIP